MDLGNGKSCQCPGPFHLPRPIRVPSSLDGTAAVNVLLVIFTAGLWLIPLLVWVIIDSCSNSGGKLAQSQAAWDHDHFGIGPNYRFPLPRL